MGKKISSFTMLSKQLHQCKEEIVLLERPKKSPKRWPSRLTRRLQRRETLSFCPEKSFCLPDAATADTLSPPGRSFSSKIQRFTSRRPRFTSRRGRRFTPSAFSYFHA